ncbi:hypothetical protein CBER1_02426 [Lecanosticta acicola]|uniref:RED-like N-terminal domain-containing protein n=1 Tax=Lecanosticta acicola TaxID=111012 RepID=A0AAI8Z607_9PEZI|nr:hypothetical protein CBER1_02426 [Lecanosticta acicola]
MNNDAFRKLVSEIPAHKSDGSPGAKPSALGARKSAFLGMTPRPGKAPSNADFARQVREQHAAFRPRKQFKSVAPKGSKFGAGYTDRTKARQEAEDEEDDKAKRITALEEQVKLGNLPQETFEALRDQITGGDASSTHLVKGLDRKLLERVRRGEDVLGLGESQGEEEPPDVEHELDKLGEQEIQAVERKKEEKKGTKAVAGVKRTRDEIMAELKAQRKAAAEAKAAAAPQFDSRWRKVGDQSKPRIEIDHKGREVLITVDEDGTVKKKIRKVPAKIETGHEDTVRVADDSRPVLGADAVVPEQKPKPPELEDEEDDDIFEGVGTSYDPLAGLDDSDSDSDDDDREGEGEGEGLGMTAAPEETGKPDATLNAEKETQNPAAPTEQPKGPRSYFKDSTSNTDEIETDRFKGIENVLKKAAKMETAVEDDEDDIDDEGRREREERLAKRNKMLQQQDRDLDDMDVGFGGSRYEDDEEGEESKIRLSEWKGGAAAGDDGWEEDVGKGGKKKRKPKKRKGDVNNAADIMRVIEGRKGGGSQ